MRKIMSSLDIGYASIKLIVAEINKKKLYVLTSSIVNNDALKKDMTIILIYLKKRLVKTNLFVFKSFG